MRDLGSWGAVRGKAPRTTLAAAGVDRQADLVERHLVAVAPNRLWVADLTCVKTDACWIRVAFIIDVFSRFVVGWQASQSLRTELALDALEIAVWGRKAQQLQGLVHHSDRVVQYLAVRHTERLAEAGAVARLLPKVPVTRMLWPNPSTLSTRPSKSARPAPGAGSRISNTPPSTTSTGSTNAGSTGSWAWRPPQSSKLPISMRRPKLSWLFHTNPSLYKTRGGSTVWSSSDVGATVLTRCRVV